MTRWREPITISVAARHGRKKLHTFHRLDGAERQWTVATPHSYQEVATHGRPKLITTGGIAGRLAPPASQRRIALGIDGAVLDENNEHTIHLARGVDPRVCTLTVILDALLSDDRRDVDLSDIKTVLSQQTPRITKFRALPVDSRESFKSALYSAILQCCATV